MNKGEKMLELLELFKKFPGIGQRQAERFSRFIAKQDKEYAEKLSNLIKELNTSSKQCKNCLIQSEFEGELCEICNRKNTDTIVIVEKDIDVFALEESMDKLENISYFILKKLIPIATNISTHERIPKLKKLIKEKKPKEIILALSVHPDADHTIQYLTNELKKDFDIKISALGRGLSSGSELEYSDPETLKNAIKRRISI